VSITSTTLGTAPVSGNPVPRLKQRTSKRVAGRAPGRGRDQRTAPRRLRRAHINAVAIADDLVHYGVAMVLMIVAAVVLYHTTYDLATTSEPFAQTATTAVNGALFAIIIMEVMRTVMAHFDRGGLHLQPFLVIGIISAVREILSVGAHLSLQSPGQDGGLTTVHLALMELAVNGAVVLGLAAALVLIRRLAGMREASSTQLA
jgi:uncharacterized membrane protein (DUF373 family)